MYVASEDLGERLRHHLPGRFASPSLCRDAISHMVQKYYTNIKAKNLLVVPLKIVVATNPNANTFFSFLSNHGYLVVESISFEYMSPINSKI